MKKALYLHGFLGGASDMKPLFLEGYDCEAFSLRNILFKDDYLKSLASQIEQYDFILGYSFGGRILEELKDFYPEKSKKWILVSSRHSPYPEKEIIERGVFRQKLYAKLEESSQKKPSSFFDYWSSLSLFDGHKMDAYRQKYNLGYSPWNVEEIGRYLDVFFTTYQVDPRESDETYYFHGKNDFKYSLEGERLKNKFKVQSLEGGHRFLFENPESFKKKLKKTLEADAKSHLS